MPRTPGTHLAVLPPLAGRTSRASHRRLAMHAPGARAAPDEPPVATTSGVGLPSQCGWAGRATASPYLSRYGAEESPGSTGQGGGQHPPGATRGKVPQKTDRHSCLRAGAVRVKRWCKRPPATRATGSARQTPPGARSRSPVPQGAGRAYAEGGSPEYAGRSLEGVGNGTRRWMVAPRVTVRDPGTEPGLQASPSAPHCLTCGNAISEAQLSAYCPQISQELPALLGSLTASGRPRRP